MPGPICLGGSVVGSGEDPMTGVVDTLDKFELVEIGWDSLLETTW